MNKEKKSGKNLSNNLKRLSEIVEWFDNQEEINVEEGLKKVKEAAVLIKTSKERLRAIRNEFEEIKKEMNIKESSGKKKEEDSDIKENENHNEEPDRDA